MMGNRSLLALQALQHPFEHDGGGDFAVGGFGDDDGGGCLDDVVGDDHVATDNLCQLLYYYLDV